jgi:hypothetical protein
MRQFSAYSTFVSMQTGMSARRGDWWRRKHLLRLAQIGNTIFIALGTSGQNSKPFGWARSLCSLGCFTIGCFSFARIHEYLGGARLRRTVVLSFLLQTICVVAIAAIIQSGIIDGSYPSARDPADVDFTELVAVALLSFQAAGQIVNSRGLGVSEVPTVVITSLLCDLVSDGQLLARPGDNAKRNKRAVAFVLTLTGAICGGWISKATGAVQPSLWLVAAIKAFITLYWVVSGPLLVRSRG